MKPTFQAVRDLLASWRRIPPIIAIGIITTGLALAFYGYLGFFSRYYADDFCMSGMVFDLGFWNAQVAQYTGWSNRFSGMFLLSVSEWLGRSFIQYWTALTLLVWVACLTWALSKINRWLNLQLSTGFSLLFAETIILFTLLLAPQLFQSLFWRIGLITYTLPLVLLSLAIGLVVRFYLKTSGKRPSWAGLAAIAGLTFFSGGLSETYLTLQTSLGILAIAGVIFFNRRDSKSRWLWLLAAALFGSILSFAAVLLSPGNAVRQAFMPSPPELLPFLRMVATNAFVFMYRSIQYNSFQVILAFLGPMLVTYGYYAQVEKVDRRRPSPLITAIFLVPVVSYLAIAAAMVPAAYAQSSYPDGRVLIDASFLLVLMFVLEGWLLGTIFSQLHQWSGEVQPLVLRLITVGLLLVVFLYPVYDMRRSYLMIPEFRLSAENWDRRDRQIQDARKAGVENVGVIGYNAPGGLEDLRFESDHWINQCAAQFYDLSSLQVVEP